jgi:hypothetical protein
VQLWEVCDKKEKVDEEKPLYSSAQIHICWKDESELSIDAPSHAEYLVFFSGEQKFICVSWGACKRLEN